LTASMGGCARRARQLAFPRVPAAMHVHGPSCGGCTLHAVTNVQRSAQSTHAAELSLVPPLRSKTECGVTQAQLICIGVCHRQCTQLVNANSPAALLRALFRALARRDSSARSGPHAAVRSSERVGIVASTAFQRCNCSRLVRSSA
jgi:hypothetical protein